ncbi:type III-A CRISPR-associated RAMP protein Csm3 [Thermoflexus hugenholtzii]|uniref:CRISPR system Cms endoribonuclease Csm3 n=1 Tax=Thermoflexus hugenholtzii JAD2 TaxID=877466 RepID=A0A212R0M2_9CHLR|nr:type III-A CRISPR-associated RAMP protein Csm3 [Thermoflexus hugenholtzii]SNB65445.1 CRISPR-associated protein, Csm3 family [Thermoflexus hugenholtzii JAD2]
MSGNIVQLQGKIVIAGTLQALTGLRIGGVGAGMEIGGVENVVIRDPVTGRPYVPGSSLKGKMRSLLTRALGKPLKVLSKNPLIRIHWCETEAEYRSGGRPCPLCRAFGVAGQRALEPVRLIVRDARLLEELEILDENGQPARKRWSEVNTDLPYTEVKSEAAIDVLTAAANPRQMERVPAGARFEVELLFSVYDADDREAFRTVLLGMRLLEDDYLGGSGSRGYGRVAFRDLRVMWKPVAHYLDPQKHPAVPLAEGRTVEEMIARFDELAARIPAFEGKQG